MKTEEKKDKAEKKVSTFKVVNQLKTALPTIEGPAIIQRTAVLRAGSEGNVSGTTAIPLWGLTWALADWDALTPEEKAAVLREAAINITCRTGKATTSLQGKVLSLKESAVYLTSVTTRDGEPSEKDEAEAEALWTQIKNDAHKKAHDLDENDPLYGNVEHFQRDFVLQCGIGSAAQCPGLNWQYTSERTPLDNLKWMHRAVRLWKPKISVARYT